MGGLRSDAPAFEHSSCHAPGGPASSLPGMRTQVFRAGLIVTSPRSAIRIRTHRRPWFHGVDGCDQARERTAIRVRSAFAHGRERNRNGKPQPSARSGGMSLRTARSSIVHDQLPAIVHFRLRHPTWPPCSWPLWPALRPSAPCRGDRLRLRRTTAPVRDARTGAFPGSPLQRAISMLPWERSCLATPTWSGLGKLATRYAGCSGPCQ
jgi:hypothetical protein